MNSVQHRDRWASQKRLTPEIVQHIAEIKTRLQATLIDETRALAEAEAEICSSSDFKGFYAGVDRLTETTRRLALMSHEIQNFCDWGVPPVCEFNNHEINVNYLMPQFKRTFWLEGAAFCGLGLREGMRILELCCGSGFYTDMFYAPFASEIVAVDFDPRALETAARLHPARNIRYEWHDIRHSLPDGPFDAVIWDGAIEHFTEAEIESIMGRLGERMVNNAPLLGYTVAETTEAPEHPDHETHFEGIADLGALLKRFFTNVRVFERIHPTLTPKRHNLFFYASDGILPFDSDWAHGLRL